MDSSVDLGGIRVKHVREALDAGKKVNNLLVQVEMKSWEEGSFVVYDGCTSYVKKLEVDSSICSKCQKTCAIQQCYYRLRIVVGDETGEVWATAWDRVAMDILRLQPKEFAMKYVCREQAFIEMSVIEKEFFCRLTRGARTLRIDRVDSVGVKVLFPDVSPMKLHEAFGSGVSQTPDATVSSKGDSVQTISVSSETTPVECMFCELLQELVKHMDRFWRLSMSIMFLSIFLMLVTFTIQTILVYIIMSRCS